jgi:hypothetical protein
MMTLYVYVYVNFKLKNLGIKFVRHSICLIFLNLKDALINAPAHSVLHNKYIIGITDICPSSVFLCSLEYRTMEKVQKPTNF